MQKFSKMDIFIGIILILAMIIGVGRLETAIGLPTNSGTFIVSIIALVIGLIVGKRALNRAKELEKEHTPTNWQVATDPEFKNQVNTQNEDRGDEVWREDWVKRNGPAVVVEKSGSRGLVTPQIYWSDGPKPAPRGCTPVRQNYDDLGYVEPSRQQDPDETLRRGWTCYQAPRDDSSHIEPSGRYADRLGDLATGVVVGMAASELVEAVVERINDTDTSGGGDSYEPSGGGSD